MQKTLSHKKTKPKNERKKTHVILFASSNAVCASIKSIPMTFEAKGKDLDARKLRRIQIRVTVNRIFTTIF